jgi:hypothetical protein
MEGHGRIKEQDPEKNPDPARIRNKYSIKRKKCTYLFAYLLVDLLLCEAFTATHFAYLVALVIATRSTVLTVVLPEQE